jgi:hypothetical protein
MTQHFIYKENIRSKKLNVKLNMVSLNFYSKSYTHTVERENGDTNLFIFN